jgi:hypothetical protein
MQATYPIVAALPEEKLTQSVSGCRALLIRFEGALYHPSAHCIRLRPFRFRASVVFTSVDGLQTQE